MLNFYEKKIFMSNSKEIDIFPILDLSIYRTVR